MIRTFVLAIIALHVFASCATRSANNPYAPATRAERIEFANDRLDVYPDDIRKNLLAHTNAPVVWVGVIRSFDARELDSGNQIMADAVFEHHYFDWVQDGKKDDIKLSVSPRGEGLFATRCFLDKVSNDATFENAEKYAAKGKLAILYGTPARVNADGTVVLEYRYMRVLGRHHFSTNEFDYGRLGDSFHVLHPGCKPCPTCATNTVSAKGN